VKTELRKLSWWLPLLRLCPVGTPGKSRLGHWLLRSVLHGRDVTVRTQRGESFLMPSLAEPIGFHLLVDGVYEPETMAFVLHHLTSGGTFVDVGANIGVFTISAGRAVGETGCVLAIEPSPRMFPYLSYNVSVNGLTNVSLQEGAIFDCDVSQLPFYEAPVEHFGMGALAPQFFTKPISVSARSLDSLLAEKGIRHVDVLKVDVEGFEAAVFRGAVKLLTGEAPPVIIFEFCDWAEERVPEASIGDAQRVLHEYGYSIWRMTDFATHRPPLQAILATGFEMLVAQKERDRA
jgi:FkbM family methyltransferase